MLQLNIDQHKEHGEGDPRIQHGDSAKEHLEHPADQGYKYVDEEERHLPAVELLPIPHHHRREHQITGERDSLGHQK